EQELEAPPVTIPLVPTAADGRIYVDAIAVLLVLEERDAVREHVIDQAVGGAAADLRRGRIRNELDVDRPLAREARRAARVLDDTERRVLAEQRALRPAQHLHAFEVGEILIGHADVTQKDIVDDDPDGRLHVVVAARLADSAD